MSSLSIYHTKGSMTDETDAQIAFCHFQFFLQFAAIMILVSITNCILLIPTAIVTIIFYGLRHIYVNTARCIKRIESLGECRIYHSIVRFGWCFNCLFFIAQHQTGRSPIFTHTNATVNGLSTIRACKAQHIVAKEFDELQDINTSAWYIFAASSRALALWLETVCVIYMGVVLSIFLLIDRGECFVRDSVFRHFVPNCISITFISISLNTYRLDWRQRWSGNHTNFEFDYDEPVGHATNGRTRKLHDIGGTGGRIH